MKHRIQAVLTALAILLTFNATAQDPEAVQQHIRERIEAMQADGLTTLQGHRVLGEDILATMYEQNQYQPLWTNPDSTAEAIQLFGDAESHGLLPEDFLYFTLHGLRPGNSAIVAAEHDILMTEALLRYAYQREFGKVNPGSLDRDINFERQISSDIDIPALLSQWIRAGELERRIDEETIQGDWYQLLRTELNRLLARANEGELPRVDDGPTLHPGDSSTRVRQVRARLGHHGDEILPPSVNPDLYDDALITEVKTFQQDHHLDADGIIGPATLDAMNVTVHDRIDQLRTSMERLRWVNQERAGHDSFIAANIAGFRIYVVKDNELAWTSRAMVGKPYRQTPVFTSDLRYLEFNPTWTVPPGIHRNDVLPKVKEDVNYLAEKNFIVLTPQGEQVDPLSIDWNSYGRVAPYIFRQVPGPWNALGQVKFIFPNPHFVFFHDTNHRELFSQPSRAFSSGCIRVQDPMDLAEVLLADKSGWDRDKIDSTVASGKTTRVNLDEPLPVYLVYLTAAPDTDGSVLYLPDVYERDGKLLAALDQPMHWDLPNQP